MTTEERLNRLQKEYDISDRTALLIALEFLEHHQIEFEFIDYLDSVEGAGE